MYKAAGSEEESSDEGTNYTSEYVKKKEKRSPLSIHFDCDHPVNPDEAPVCLHRIGDTCGVRAEETVKDGCVLLESPLPFALLYFYSYRVSP